MVERCACPNQCAAARHKRKAHNSRSGDSQRCFALRRYHGYASASPQRRRHVNVAGNVEIRSQHQLLMDQCDSLALGLGDFVQNAVQIKAAFESTGGRSTAGNTMTFIGPDPDTGNAIAGLSLGAHTDTWELGVNYDWIRGSNSSTTQVGALTLLGRI